MTTAPYTTSFPVMAAAKEFGCPLPIAFNMAWGIILNAREQPQTGWTRASADLALQVLGWDKFVAMHDKLLATAIAQKVVPAQELPRG